MSHALEARNMASLRRRASRMEEDRRRRRRYTAEPHFDGRLGVLLNSLTCKWRVLVRRARGLGGNFTQYAATHEVCQYSMISASPTRKAHPWKNNLCSRSMRQRKLRLETRDREWCGTKWTRWPALPVV